MALFDSGLTHRYRRFRAHNEHTYPVSFFMIGLLKFLGEIALVGVVLLSLIALVMKVSGRDDSAFLAAENQDTTVEILHSVAGAPVESPVGPARQIAQADPLHLQTPPQSSSNSDTAEPDTLTGYPVSADEQGLPVSEKVIRTVVTAKLKEGVVEGETASIFDHEWILARPGQHFVIQLAASDNLDKLLDFSSELEDDKISIYPFKVTANKETMYGVSVGEYATIDQAMDAVRQFPPSVKRYNPWVRKVAAVQKQILSVAGR